MLLPNKFRFFQIPKCSIFNECWYKHNRYTYLALRGHLSNIFYWLILYANVLIRSRVSSFASHESTCHRLRAWCWLCFHARYPRERQPWITVTYRYWPKKIATFYLQPLFFWKLFQSLNGKLYEYPKFKICVCWFFFGVFRWGRGQFQSQLRQVLFVFMATSLTTCALWNLLWIGPGLPTAPSGLNGRGLMSLRLRGLANGIISHFDLTFVLVETSRDVRKLHVNLSVGASRGASQSLETFGVWTSRCNWLWG